MSRSIAAALIVAGIAGAGNPAFAQLKLVPEYINKMLSTGDRMFSEAQRDDFDEDVVESLLKQFSEASEGAANAILEFGAESLRSVPEMYRQPLIEPYQMARDLHLLLDEDVKGRCKKLRDLLDLQPQSRPDDFHSQVDSCLRGCATMSAARRNEWQKLVKKNEDVRKYLSESLQAAIAMKEDAAKPIIALSSARRQIEAKIQEQAQEIDRLNEVWTQSSKRLRELDAASVEALKAYVSATTARSGNNAAAVQAALQRMVDVDDEYEKECGRNYEVHSRLMKASEASQERMRELARLLKDIEKFQKDADPQAIVERCAALEIALKVFEEESRL